ncbi:hypothetical protein SNEBB_007195 [Seison nebaliae]|nr:hypothetical protein SNEBB_007195 [Seison nebaliae]
MLASLKKELKEKEASSTMYQSLDRTTVLQEAKVFNEMPLNAKRCSLILTKIIYILNQGEAIGSREATECFFAMTKLFQHSDSTMRRLMYLTIKELAPIAQDVIIVTSSLTKDMMGKDEAFRAPAIRALCRITDSSMLHSIERYLKQAIVDRSPAVASAALTSTLRLGQSAPDIIKRWLNEVQEACSSDDAMVQYHALGLLYQMKKHDRLAINRLVTKHSRTCSTRSPMAMCFLIRVAAQLFDESGGENTTLKDFITMALRNKNDMVVYEAATAIVNLNNVSSTLLQQVVGVLQLLTGSSKQVMRYAAIKTLNRIAIKYPELVSTTNNDLEILINDSNRSIATLAITTLLKTGGESGVEKLTKKISSFMTDISDEFKIVVVDAVKSLCMKFPRKHPVLVNFLAGMLRDEGGFEYKRTIVNTIICIMEDNPDSKETVLTHLCEFIEDCEHTSLATRVLQVLGREGPRMYCASKYIRYIYNRIILENTTIRAAAVSALAQFGASNEALLPSILTLLKRSMLDSDDEVRDRAVFYLNSLQKESEEREKLMSSLDVNPQVLEKYLYEYTKRSMKDCEKEFKLDNVPKIIYDDHKTKSGQTGPLGDVSSTINASSSATQIGSTGLNKSSTQQHNYVTDFLTNEHLRNLNDTLFHSSVQPIVLTESEVEYTVECVKHMMNNFIVFQFNIVNTIEDQFLEKVYVEMISNTNELTFVKYIYCEKLSYQETGICYAIFKLSDNDSENMGIMYSCNLKFVVHDCDPVTGKVDDDPGYDDEFNAGKIELTLADNIHKVNKLNFDSAWNSLANELKNIIALESKSIPEAVGDIIKFIGMQPCEHTEKVSSDKITHMLLLSGVFRGGHSILAKCRLAMNPIDDGAPTVTMQMTMMIPSIIGRTFIILFK